MEKSDALSIDYWFIVATSKKTGKRVYWKGSGGYLGWCDNIKKAKHYKCKGFADREVSDKTKYLWAYSDISDPKVAQFRVTYEEVLTNV